MWESFRDDLRRWVVPSHIAPVEALTPGTVLRLLLQYMPVRAMLLFRLGSWFKDRGIPVLPGALQRAIYSHYGLEIQPGADIGGGLYVAHPVGTVIACQHMGRNVSIIAAVTIGMRNEWAFPVIGDNVFIGAGARILGNIRIGNDVQIGANSVVISDVPDGATVVGIPAQVIKIYGQRVDGERITVPLSAQERIG